jgi:UrcA family protein
VGLAGAALPALAQPVDETTTVEGLTITGHYRVDDNVRSLSAAVPYDDLDLTTAAGRDVLKQRIRATAHDLCDRLGETNTANAIAPSCEQDAWDNARSQIHAAVASARMPDYAYIGPYETYMATAPSAPAYSQDVAATEPTAPAAPTYTTQTVTNGPVPDTAENRARYGGPVSRGGQATRPDGN